MEKAAKVTPDEDKLAFLSGVVSLRKHHRMSITDQNDALAWACQPIKDEGTLLQGKARRDDCLKVKDKEKRTQIESEVSGIAARLADMKKNERFLIRPDADFMARWDVVLLVALSFTALVSARNF